MVEKPAVTPVFRSRPRPRDARNADDSCFAWRPLLLALAAWSCGYLPLQAHAQLPVGPTVVHGSATVDTVGTQMTVTTSPNTIINWSSFSIGAPNGVHIQQVSAASQVLNRDTGTDPSQILGSLSSNGVVWVINPYGVLFGRNARIDVAGLVASTLDIANDDFLGNRFNFVATGGIAKPGEVLNQSNILTPFGGRVWLLGEQVRNEGLIETRGGEIVLAAGKSIELVDSGAPNVVVRVAAKENTAVNLGTLMANGGSVDVHGGIVNQEGIIRADSVGSDAAGRVVLKAKQSVMLGENSQTRADGRQGGEVVVETTEGTTLVAGRVSARGENGAGGKIHLLGQQVGVYGQAVVDASGATGGGEILVGGDYQGKNPTIRNASAAFVGPDATLAANALAHGDGGRVIVWSNDATRVYGTLTAKGGTAGGNGGFIETSGGWLDARPRSIDVTAPMGAGGTWLLDPNNITITVLPLDSPTRNISVDLPLFISNDDDAAVDANFIGALLSAGTNVIIRTGDGGANGQDGNITVAANMQKVGFEGLGLPASLTLSAHNNITVDSGVSINSSDAPLNVTFIADNDGSGSGAIAMLPGSSIVTNGGDVEFRGREFHNSSGDAAISTSGAGRWLIYVDDPATSTEGFTSYNKHYNQPYTGSTPAYADSGSWFLYSRAPTLSVTPNSETITYGDATPAFTPAYAGFIDGDTTAGLTGTPAWDVAGSTSGSSKPNRGDHDVSFTGGLASSLGYQFADNTDSVNELKVNPRTLTASVAAPNKVYDGNAAATPTLTITGGLLDEETVTATGAATFNSKNVLEANLVTVNSNTLADGDNGLASNYSLATGQTVAANITPKALTIAAATAENKTYDGNNSARITGVTLSGLVSPETVIASGTGATFDNKDVGTGKKVTFTGNTLANGANGGLASNYSLIGGGTAAAGITPATLTYVAEPALGVVGVPVTGLTGTVTGFLGADTPSGATTGTPAWTSPATTTSGPGSYLVAGSGLAAINYDFVQHPANATALTLVGLASPASPQQQGVNNAVTSVQTAVAMALPTFPFNVSHVMDMISLPKPSFGPVNLAAMSRDDIQQLLESRAEFKRKLFAEAIFKLEQDPSLADVRPCPSLADVDSGRCRMTDAQREEHLVKEAQAKPDELKQRVKLAKLPQIERKLAVLIGINQYADNDIPALENAVPDVEVVGKLLADRLGYEVRVVKNATKADIVRALNQLSAEIQPNDSVIVYYAGHGYLIEKTGVGYWIPADASVSAPTGWISNTDVSRMLADIKAKQLAMISDSCYSGAFTKEQKVVLSDQEVKPEEVLTRRSVVVMSSGGDEPVADEGKGGHSIFAWHLLRAIGDVDNWQPGNTVFQKVQRDVSNSFRNFRQTPQYGASASAGHQPGGEYLFEFRQLEGVR